MCTSYSLSDLPAAQCETSSPKSRTLAGTHFLVKTFRTKLNVSYGARSHFSRLNAGVSPLSLVYFLRTSTLVWLWVLKSLQVLTCFGISPLIPKHRQAWLLQQCLYAWIERIRCCPSTHHIPSWPQLGRGRALVSACCTPCR